MPATASVPSAPKQDDSKRREPSVVLPLLAILAAIAVPVALVVLAGVGGGIVVAAVGILAVLCILYGMTVAMQRIMGDES